MDDQEWKRRVKALREAEAACVLPVGTRVQVRGSLEIGTRRGVVKDAGTADVAVQLDGASLLTVYQFDDIEVIDEPEWPLWLRPGMTVRLTQEDGVFFVVSVDSLRAGLYDAVGGIERTEPVHDLKPYVPRFVPGDRVMLATTGKVFRVVEATRSDTGIVVVWDDDGYNRPVSAHLLTKLEGSNGSTED